LQKGFDDTKARHDARGQEIIQQGIDDHINDLLSHRSRIDLDIAGPYALNVDCDDENLCLRFSNDKGGNRNVTVPLKIMQPWMARYWNNLRPFTQSDAPQGDLRRLFEKARSNTHGLAEEELMAAVRPQRISMSRDIGAGLFGLLAYVYPHRQNPSATVHLRMAGL